MQRYFTGAIQMAENWIWDLIYFSYFCLYNYNLKKNIYCLSLPLKQFDNCAFYAGSS